MKKVTQYPETPEQVIMPSMSSKQYNARLYPPQVEALKEIAGLLGVSVNEAIRRAVNEYIERHRLHRKISR